MGGAVSHPRQRWRTSLQQTTRKKKGGSKGEKTRGREEGGRISIAGSTVQERSETTSAQVEILTTQYFSIEHSDQHLARGCPWCPRGARSGHDQPSPPSFVRRVAVAGIIDFGFNQALSGSDGDLVSFVFCTSDERHVQSLPGVYLTCF